GGGIAVAGERFLVVPSESHAVVQVGKRYQTVLSFRAIDLECGYVTTLAPFGLEPKGSPMLFCSRASTPGSSDPNAIQSRSVFVSRFRYYVTDNHGNVVYKVTRTP